MTASTAFRVQPLATTKLQQAQALVVQQWGQSCSRQFVEHVQLARQQKGECYSILYREDLLGLGLIVPAEINEEWWGVSWLVVHQDYRGQGLGGLLMQRLEQHALRNSPDSFGNCILQLTTAAPRFYERLGYRNVMQYHAGQWHLMVKVCREGFVWTSSHDEMC